MAPEASATQGSLPPDVEQLKAEGNALFAKSSFLAAIDKYDAAIEKVANSAILHANRAACYIGLERYKEAVADATKATQLDAKYAKGWGRLGAAQEALDNTAAAQNAYTRAISCFEGPLSETNQKLKEQYERYLSALSQGAPRHIVMQQGTWENKMPWDLARQLPPQPPNSSTWVIIEANDEFEEAMRLIKSLQMSQGMAIGLTGGLTLLTNAILLDERCFHIRDQKWMELYNNYVIFESTKTGAWKDTRDLVELIRLAKSRLVSSGWDQVRPALAVTVRGWIMRAFMGPNFGGSAEESVAWYERVITTLELGRREWPNVHKDDCGAIFEITFLRGVRNMHINAYMRAVDIPGRKSPFSLARLIELADAVLMELDQNKRDPTTTLTPGFISAFEIYPRGTALAVKGFYHVQMAKRGSKSPEECTAHMGESAKFYLEAAEKYPEDDEHHVMFLHQSLTALFASGTPARKTLALMECIRLAMPKMFRIWKYSSTAAQGVHRILDTVLEAEKQMRQDLVDGKFTLEDKIMLKLEP